MASRTHTVNPRVRQQTVPQNIASPDRKSDNRSPKRLPQQKNVRREEGFTVVEPNAAQRQRIANAAAREEAHVKRHHEQRRAEVVQMMNREGPTANRLGGGNIDMQEVRRRQVQQAEQQLKRGNKFPVSPPSSNAVEEGDKLSPDDRATPEGYTDARKRIVEQAENQMRQKRKTLSNS